VTAGKPRYEDEEGMSNMFDSEYPIDER